MSLSSKVNEFILRIQLDNLSITSENARPSDDSVTAPTCQASILKLSCWIRGTNSLTFGDSDESVAAATCAHAHLLIRISVSTFDTDLRIDF